MTNIENNDNNTKLLHQMQVLEKKYDQLSMSVARSDGSVMQTMKDTSWFVNYIRKGDSALVNAKSFAYGADSKTTNLTISGDISKEIVDMVSGFSCMKKLCSVEVISGNYLDVIKQEEEFKCSWGIQVTGDVNTAFASIKSERILLNDLYACPKAPQDLLDDECVDIEKWIIEELGKRFAQEEDKVLLSVGENVVPEGRPQSIANYYLKLQETDEKITSLAEDEVLNIEKICAMIGSLKSRYRQNATFLMSTATLHYLKSLKDTNGRFIVHSNVTPYSDTLFGIPVICSDYLASASAGEKELKILLGDFKSAYKIAEHSELQVIRDPYSHKPYISFYVRKRIGGSLVNPNAICALIKKSS